MLFEKMKDEHEKIERELEKLEREIVKLPSGRLKCKRDGRYFKWFCLENGVRTYVPKKKKDYIRNLAKKEYLVCSYEDLKKEKELLELYLNKRAKVATKLDKLLNEKAMFKEIIESCFQPVDSKLAAWMNENYETKTNCTSYAMNRTASGRFVRSKSESIIASVLDNYRIPYRYECKLNLGEHTIYPDFTIMHPKTGKIYYWEHLGMADDEKYFRNANWKLELYASHNIYPMINLITTYETKDNHLDAQWVETIVKYYFVN